MRITLTVIAGPHKGQVFSFVGHDTFIVGRSKRAHFRLPVKDRYFSRVHFMVELNPPACRLMDVGSTNGTFVNDQEVAMADLKHGDLIKAGRTMMRVSMDGGEEAQDLANLSASFAVPLPSGATFPETILEGLPAELAAAPPPLVPPLEPAASPFAAPFSKRPVPGTGHRAGSSTLLCRVCSARVPAAGREGGAEPGPPPVVPLCAACQEQIRHQPQPIAGYQIVRQLGKGGMGIVHLAIRVADGSLAALKTIIPTAASTKAQVQRFLREASILGQLDHPNIVAFRDMGESNDQMFFAMDYVPGTDAAHLLKAEGPLPVGRAVGLVCQVLEALEYAHAKGFVHRDIKPANVLVTPVKGREVVKLTDFGLARVYLASRVSGLTLMGDVGGTTAFMAPEQITHFREAKPPVDQYSAGATLYNLLTNRYIYELPRKVQQLLLVVLLEEIVPIWTRRPDIPRELGEVIHQSLAREPGERFADVAAMRRALIKFAE